MALKCNQESERQVKIIITPGTYYWWVKTRKEKEKQKRWGEKRERKKGQTKSEDERSNQRIQ